MAPQSTGPLPKRVPRLHDRLRVDNSEVPSDIWRWKSHQPTPTRGPYAETKRPSRSSRTALHSLRACGTSIATADWSVLRASEGEISVGTVIGATRIGIRISMRGRPPVNRLRLVTDCGIFSTIRCNGLSVWDGTGNSRIMKLLRPVCSAAVMGAAASTNLIGRTLRRETAYPGLRESRAPVLRGMPRRRTFTDWYRRNARRHGRLDHATRPA